MLQKNSYGYFYFAQLYFDQKDHEKSRKVKTVSLSSLTIEVQYKDYWS